MPPNVGGVFDSPSPAPALMVTAPASAISLAVCGLDSLALIVFAIRGSLCVFRIGFVKLSLKVLICLLWRCGWFNRRWHRRTQVWRAGDLQICAVGVEDFPRLIR